MKEKIMFEKLMLGETKTRELNDKHENTNTGRTTWKLYSNDFTKMVGMMGFSVLVASSLSACGSMHKSRIVEVQNVMQSTVERTIDEDDPDILETAEKIDYYRTADDFLSDNDEFYSEIEEKVGHPEADDSTPSYEEFKESLDRTLTNWDYMSRRGRYIQFSEEEINGFYSEMYNDYIVITRYLDNNGKGDYDKLFDEGLKYKLAELFELQESNGLHLNDIQFATEIDEETQKEVGYAIVDMDINGENIQFEARNRLYDILADRYGSGISSYQIETLLNCKSLDDLNEDMSNVSTSWLLDYTYLTLLASAVAFPIAYKASGSWGTYKRKK